MSPKEVPHPSAEDETSADDLTPTTPAEAQEVPPGETPATPEAYEPTTPAEGEAPEATTQVTAEVPPRGNPTHTTFLVQHDIKPETRTHCIYEDANERMEGVYKIYEELLRMINPNIHSVWGSKHIIPSITYDISQLL